MKSIKKLFLYGFLLWFIPFIFSFIFSSLRETEPIFYKAITTNILATTLITVTFLYLKNVDSKYLRTSIFISLIWLSISILFDLPIFASGIVDLGVGEYFGEVAFSYLLIILFPISSGLLMNSTKEKTIIVEPNEEFDIENENQIDDIFEVVELSKEKKEQESLPDDNKEKLTS